MVRERQVERLGYYMDGDVGAACIPVKFDLTLVGLTCHCLREQRVSTKMLQIMGGRWNRKFQLRREVSMVFRQFYRALETGGRESLSGAAEGELILAMCLMPLMITDFRLVVSPLVTASDASETGWAVTRSESLAEEGRACLE